MFGSVFNPTPADTSVWMSNAKLGLVYSVADREAQRPLPDPYPFKDCGNALAYPDADGKSGAYWAPIGNVVTNFYWSYPTAIHNSVQDWLKSGDETSLHDAAVVHRHVPWVNTPRDVIKLIDVYLLQMTTKKMLRYHWFTGEMNLARLAGAGPAGHWVSDCESARPLRRYCA